MAGRVFERIASNDRWLITIYESDNPVVRAGFAAHTYPVKGPHANLTAGYCPVNRRASVVSRKNCPDAVVAETLTALEAYAAAKGV